MHCLSYLNGILSSKRILSVILEDLSGRTNGSLRCAASHLLWPLSSQLLQRLHLELMR